MARVDEEKSPIYRPDDEYREGYNPIETRTPFQDIVVATAQDWVNPRWKLTEVRRAERESYFVIATIFENPRANQRSIDRLDIKRAFRPELHDIFNEHTRYRKAIGRPESKGWLYFTLARMRDEVGERTSAFNVEVNTIYTSHQQRDSYAQSNYNTQRSQDEGLGSGKGHFDTRLLYLAFGFTDLDKKLIDLKEQSERAARERFELQFKVESGIPISEQS